MDVFVLQLLNGLDKGGAYALIALGLTLVFGTLGVVNFAHGALFMLGAFCAVVVNRVLQMETVTIDPTQLTPWGSPMEIRTRQSASSRHTTQAPAVHRVRAAWACGRTDRADSDRLP
jgi:ABC-type branched-subunit amino acid transport system permease subunit